MSNWIKDDRGYMINVDHVRLARHYRADRDGNARVLLELTNDETTTVTVRGNDTFALDEFTQRAGAIIPATAGQDALVMRCHVGAERPVMEDLWIMRVPVIGWRVSDGFNASLEPMLPFNGVGSDDRVSIMLVLSDGNLLSAEGFDCTMEEAKQTVLSQAVTDWEAIERREAAKKAA